MDSVILFPPGASGAGSQLQIGTYLMGDPGADYGAQGLIQSLKTTNALRDGGVFSHRYVQTRTMALPLLLRDVPGQTLLQTESLLREWTTAGAYVALQPETVPSGEAVFFDILDGRWEPDYNTFENRAGRRKGTLYLDTQPFGYWPTEIILASAASIGYLTPIAINGGASVIGDVSPLAHVTLAFNPATAFAANTWLPDMVGVSFAGRPSFVPFIQPTAITGVTFAVTPSLIGDKFAPASQAWAVGGAWANTGWGLIAHTGLAIPTALTKAYSGRFRLFAFARNTPSGPPLELIADVENVYSPSIFTAMATGNQLATAYSVTPQASVYSASPAYSILDMGEIAMPAQASQAQQAQRIRLWAGGGTPSQTGTFLFGGFYLLPVDSSAGILAKGMVIPTIGAASAVIPGLATSAGVTWNQNFVNSVSLGLGYMDGLAYYRGAPLRVSASTSQFTFISGDRLSGGGAVPVADATKAYASVSITYRPTFQFLHGL